MNNKIIRNINKDAKEKDVSIITYGSTMIDTMKNHLDGLKKTLMDGVEDAIKELDSDQVVEINKEFNKIMTLFV